LIAATLVSTSVYSQSYESSSSPAQTTDPAAQKEQTPDYTSRQSESGAPASGEFSSSSSSSGYEKSPGSSGGNSSTGHSTGANVTEDKTLTTRDSDVSGSEYRGKTESEPERSFNSELSAGSDSSSASGASASDEIGVSSSADGAAHVPAAPVREGNKSEGWSTSGTFSGAGPGAISGSASSTSPDATPGVSSKSNNFNAEVSSNAALSDRDDALNARGLEPDSSQLSQQNSVEGDLDHDHVLIFEDWTVAEPSRSIGGAAGAESGSASSSDDISVSVDSSGSDSDYATQLHERVQHDWSSRLGSDMPATPLFDRSLDELSRTRYSTEDSVGAPAGSVSGSATKSDSDSECNTHKGKGAAAGYEQGTSKSDSDLDRSLRSSGTAIDHDERLHREYQFKSESDSSVGSSSLSAPNDDGDRSYDDGHISGNNSASGSSGSVESSGSASDSDDNSVKQPDL